VGEGIEDLQRVGILDLNQSGGPKLDRSVGEKEFKVGGRVAAFMADRFCV
jgi:hypothetical protein